MILTLKSSMICIQMYNINDRKIMSIKFYIFLVMNCGAIASKKAGA